MATHDRPATDTAALPPEDGSATIPGQRTGSRAADRSRGSRRKPKTGIKRYLKPIAIGTGVCVALTAISGWLYYEHLNSNIKTSKKNLSDVQGKTTAPNAFGQVPLNILLLGSDSRASDADVALGGGKDQRDRAALADVQMLLHVSADRSNASLISIPRDTMVHIPVCRSEDGKKTYPASGYSRINEALAHGGPGCVVGTWTELTGLNIDHFLMIDFAGVVSMAQAVGGVPVCVDENLYDRKTKLGGTGLKLPRGTTTLNAEQSLMWLRTRDAWGSDINRTKAQHMYLSSLIRTLKSQGTLTNPGKLMDLAEAATKAIKPDDGLGSIDKLYSLGTELRKVPTDRITTLTIPVDPDPRNPKVTVVERKADADRIWQMLLSDTPLDSKGRKKSGRSSAKATASARPAGGSSPAASVDRTTVRVTVQNGTGVRQRALRIAEALAGDGFTKAAVATPGNVPAQAATTLTYGAAHQAEAQAIAAALDLPATALRQSAAAAGPVLVVGTDWTAGSTFPNSAAAAAAAAPKPGALPSSAGAKTADSKDCMHVVDQGGIYTY